MALMTWLGIALALIVVGALLVFLPILAFEALGGLFLFIGWIALGLGIITAIVLIVRHFLLDRPESRRGRLT